MRDITSTPSGRAPVLHAQRLARTILPALCLVLWTAGAPTPAAAQALNFCEWTGAWAPTGTLGVKRRGATATTLNNGKVLVVGGYDGTATVASAELYDPAVGTFATTGSLATDRASHLAVLLADGRVLVAGGYRNGATVGRLASAEVYDPVMGTFSPAANMGTDRQDAAAVLLASGNVLVTGGFGRVVGTAFSNWLATSELFDPSTGAFLPTGSMATGRGIHQITRLSSGKALVTGGYDGFAAIASGEVFDPATGAFTATGSMNTARMYHTATLMPDGGVLLAGGNGSSGYLATTETYSPTSNNFAPSGNMVTPRRTHTATRLPSGRLVIAGGENSLGIVATAEISLPGGFGFAALPPMPAPRASHTASLLQDGNIVFIGGRDGSGSLDSALLYDPLFRATGSMTKARSGHTATRLESGQVLIVGGRSADPGLPPLAGAELYNPSSGAFVSAASMSTARHRHTATTLVGGRILIAGGLSGAFTGALATAELYDPFTGAFSPAGSMGGVRHGHTATRLPNGLVLITGGTNAGGPTASAELYDPNFNTFSPTGAMNHDRVDHTATLLQDGRVLITGGQSNTAGGITFSTELYNPAAGTFSPQPPSSQWLLTNRSQHAATLLADGRVLITGGLTSGLTPTRKAEVYNPNTGYFAAVGDMSTPRSSHVVTETALPAGKVLVIGGNSSFNGGYLDTVETYDPSTQTFSAAGSMQLDRVRLTATLLLDSRILVAGGANAFGSTATAELSKPTHCGPMITLMTPTSGAEGTPVTIDGRQFAGAQGASTVTFNGMIAGVGSWTDVQIATSVPFGATTGPVIVTVNGRNSNAVTFSVSRPDLVETSISDPPATVALGNGFAITDRISNIGTLSAGASTTRYYLSLDAIFDRRDILLNGTRSVGSLPAGSKPVIDTVKVSVPGSTRIGDYFVVGCVDDLKAIAESDERNNCRASLTTVRVTF